MGQNVTALVLGLWGSENLNQVNPEDEVFLWDDVLDYHNPDRPVVSVDYDAYGFVVAVDRCARNGEGELTKSVPLHALDKTFTVEADRARARWLHLARILADKGVHVGNPTLMLMRIERG